MLRKVFFTLAVFLFAVSIVHAQTIGGSAVPPPVQYSVAPETPGPNQNVTVTASGVGQFLGNATITWKQNGVVVSSANDQPSFTFKTGGIGTQTVIDLSINSKTEGFITQRFVFNPSVVNLVWEADTYTPPLYQGKALYTAGSNLKVVALPTVMIGKSLIPASQLSFQWYQNDTIDPASSGLGRNVFTIQGSQLSQEEDVAVNIYSGATKIVRGEISIPASSPQVIFYAQDPLRGELLSIGLQGNVALAQTEMTFKAEPYFFSNQSIQSNKLVYAWTLNGQDTTGPDADQGMLTLRQTSTGAGSASLGVTIQNSTREQYVQSAQAGLQLIFGQQTGSAVSSFFGL